MRSPWLILSLVLGSCAATPRHATIEHATALARKFIIVDGHIDVPCRLESKDEDIDFRTASGEFDFVRAREGGLDAPFFSIFTPAELEARGESKRVADRLIDRIDAIIAKTPAHWGLARSAADIRRIAAEGRIAILYGMENGSPIEGKIENLDEYYRRGIRYITLCHGKNNQLCDSSYDTARTWKGLSPFGKTVVKRMNQLGVLVDISHVSDDTFYDVLKIASAPPIASHSSCRKFTPGFERNMSDDMIRELGRKGGIMMINFGSTFIRDDVRRRGDVLREKVDAFMKERHLGEQDPAVASYRKQLEQGETGRFADVRDVADHIDHAVRLAGIDHVGFGSDFDGVGDTLPTGLKDVSMYPNLILELCRRGYSDSDIEKLCGANFLRVFEAAERVAAQSAP
jgi:membrane dipeptidase